MPDIFFEVQIPDIMTQVCLNIALKQLYIIAPGLRQKMSGEFSNVRYRNIALTFHALVLLLFVLALPFNSSAQKKWNTIKSEVQKPASISLVSNNEGESVIKVKIDGFMSSNVSIQGKKATLIDLQNTSRLLQKANPDLLKVTTSLIVPSNTEMKAEIVSSNFVEIPNVFMAPSKGNLSRSYDPSSLPYTFSDVYKENGFFPSMLTKLETPYILRDFTGQALVIYPFQYNPVTRTLRVYYSMEVKVSPVSETKSAIQLPAVISQDFQSIYSRHFINFDALSSKYTALAETGKMLIISHPNFMEAMQPLVNWRNTIGIPTEIVNLNNIGSTAAQIKNFVAGYYANNPISFLLLVGDAQFVPTNVLSSGHSDNAYGYLVGNDSYQEVIVGRFSVETIAHTQTMVQRTIDYEMNPQFQTNWLNKAIGIASDQGPGDDNEMDYVHVRNMLTDLMGFTYSTNIELYEGSQGGNDATGDPTANMLANSLNSGAGVILYTGHGSSNSFVTTSFNNSNINNLTNTAKLPFIFSVACVNGDFVGGTCFAEAWLRASSANQPTGAIATLMSTINQSWDPPMDGQDEMVDILVETYANNIKRTFGGISVNGLLKMNDSYGSAGTEMTDTWTIFGDPSLTIRTDTPKVIIASHPQTLFAGTTQLQVNCSVGGARASLSRNGQYITHAAFQGGTASLVFPALNAGDTIKLAVTAFNRIPYLTDIYVIAPAGPYVVAKSLAVHDPSGNNNSLADYSEQIFLDLIIENIGVASALGVNVVASSTSPYIAFLDSIDYSGSILASASSIRAYAFSLNVSDVFPDQHLAPIMFTIKDTNNTVWTATLNLTLNAPLFLANELIIKDSLSGNNNGKLEPGEIAVLYIKTSNIGHASSPSGVASLLESSSFSNMNVFSANLAPISVGGFTLLPFVIQIDNAIPLGTSIALDFSLVAGNYSYSSNYYVSIGDIREDWETNTFTKYPWTNDATKPWTITASAPFEGSFCARSGLNSTDHGKSSELTISINVLDDDTISFYYKVSCESGAGSWYDFLEFKIDGQSMGKWDGVLPWQLAAFPVSKGLHTLKWRYEKDFYYSTGLDAAYLDNIKFPPLATPAVVNETELIDVKVFPNPANDILNIQCSKTQKASRINIISMHGQVVRSINANDNEVLHSIDLRQLQAGVYIVQVHLDSKILSFRIIKS